ncbi:MAG TPA: hypothetical protein VEI97_14235, partial [bacterium]|nr:hypothetical protein [bacterium]
MSRFPRVATLFVLSLLVLGCRSDAPPVAPAPPGLAHQPAFRAGDSVPALFALRVDPATLTATAEPIQGRRGAGFQGSLFDLDLTRFQTWRQFRIAGVRLTGLDFIEISFAHAHPFPAPMLDAPPSGLNRADLGYTGRALLLADLSTEEEPAHTFFGDIKAKTELVVQPDGYVNPGDLLSAAALRANTFPYMLLVDEQKDNRVGISNGSVSPPGVVNGTGNYDPASRGWQRANLGDGNTGWTGYDFLHAGQEALNTFTLDPAHLPAGGEPTVALLIKYTEPKGSGTRALRLPPAEVDPLQFAYRLPHAALDASVITPDWSNSAAAFYERTLRSPWAGVQVEAAVGKTSTPLQIRVRDWDAQAPEAAGPDVSQSPSVGVIEPGTGGAPAA